MDLIKWHLKFGSFQFWSEIILARSFDFEITRMISDQIALHSVQLIEDITCPRVDMNFIFSWSTRYLTSERSERVRYRVDHEKIKFISISGHVIFCLLYKHQ